MFICAGENGVNTTRNKTETAEGASTEEKGKTSRRRVKRQNTEQEVWFVDSNHCTYQTEALHTGGAS